MALQLRSLLAAGVAGFWHVERPPLLPGLVQEAPVERPLCRVQCMASGVCSERERASESRVQRVERQGRHAHGVEFVVPENWHPRSIRDCLLVGLHVAVRPALVAVAFVVRMVPLQCPMGARCQLSDFCCMYECTRDGGGKRLHARRE